ncbi:unnamed protein product, partial [marine sediment metagenome]
SHITELSSHDRFLRDTENIKDLDGEELQAWVNAMDDYALYGVNVEVSGRYKPTLKDAVSLQSLPLSKTKGPEQTVPVTKLKKFRIPAAAATVVLIAVSLFLFLSTPVAKAVDLSQVYEAITKIKNVCISSFVPDRPAPTRREWVSRGLNIRLQKTQKQVVLFDLQNKIRKIKDLSTDSVQTTPITGDFLAKVESFIAGSFGLLPFPDITDVPENATWKQVADENIEAIVPGTKVYDFIWTIEKPDIELHKWRFFIDPGTKLPKRVETYSKAPSEENYTILEYYEVVTYHTDREIQAVIQSVFD